MDGTTESILREVIKEQRLIIEGYKVGPVFYKNNEHGDRIEALQSEVSRLREKVQERNKVLAEKQITITLYRVAIEKTTNELKAEISALREQVKSNRALRKVEYDLYLSRWEADEARVEALKAHNDSLKGLNSQLKRKKESFFGRMFK